ncbi:MAG: hypothetical protein ABFC54_00770 [Thermoguttaceae bacterium]
MVSRCFLRIATVASLGGWFGMVLAVGPARASTGRFELTVVDKATGRPVDCRMHIVGSKNRPFKPDKAICYHDHFIVPGKIVLKIPVGEYGFVIERGPEYLEQGGNFTIQHFADDVRRIELQRFVDMAAMGWWSGDLDVRRPVRQIEPLMRAEDLHVAEVLTWRNDRTVKLPTAPAKDPVVRFDRDRYYQRLAGAWIRPGTELLLLNRSNPLKLPAAEGDWPSAMEFLPEARRGGELWVDVTQPCWWDLPMLVAAGQVDSIQVAHRRLCRDSSSSDEGGGRPRKLSDYPSPLGNAQWSQFLYFQLLECGLRIPPSAGSGSGDSPNPVGYNRVYVHVDEPFDYKRWWQSFREGHVFVTNGPLMMPLIGGELPGHVFQSETGEPIELAIDLGISTREKISNVEILRNGKVDIAVPYETYSKSGQLPKIRFDRSGWLAIRVVTDNPKTYRFAMTGPYYVEIGGKPRISRSAARFMLDWANQRAEQIQIDDPVQKKAVMEWHRRAREFWTDVLSKANAD